MMLPEHQGFVGTLICLSANYFILLRLCFATTVELQVNKKGTSYLQGCRGASYFAVGRSFRLLEQPLPAKSSMSST